MGAGPRPTDDLGERLRRVEPREGAGLLEAVPVEAARSAMRPLDSGHQALLLEHVAPELRRELLTTMPPDERARLLGEARDPDAWLAELPGAERDETWRLLRHPPDSVGRMMTPRYLELAADEPVAASIERIRRCERDVVTIYRMPVSDGGELVGMVELRDLLGAPDDALVGEVTREVSDPLSPGDDQELAARRFLATEELALPVVDEEGTLVGVVTVDDAMEVLQLEESEDASRTSGVEPLRGPYLAASLLRLARTRALWLVVAASAGVLTVRVLETFEAELDQVVALALFIPLLLGTGGNIGAQAATTVVRAMAVDDLRLRDLPHVVWREAGVGLMLGGLLALLAAGPIAAVYEPRLALVVCLTLASVCIIGTSAGSVLPLAVGRLGADPAVVSAPFITTLVDASGLLVYFAYAQVVFDL